MKRAVAYARFSTDRQREESVDAQLRAIEDYCVRENIKLVKHYIDRGLSGTTDNREQFQKMISDSKKKIFDFVIVHKLDRFARDRYDSAIYRKRLKDSEVQVISVLERLDDSPESVILESVLEGMSEYYSKNLSREVKKGLYENARNGKFNGGRIPLGYKINPETKQFEIDEYHAAIVRRIFELYIDNYGYVSIAQKLNEEGYKNQLNASFKADSIHKLILNPVYKGTRVYAKYEIKKNSGKAIYKKRDEYLVLENSVPPIISEKIWNEAIQKTKEGLGKPRVKVKDRYLLVGYAKCEKCGANYIGTSSLIKRSKKRARYYTCSKHNRRLCDAKLVNADLLEEIVIDQIHAILNNKKAIDFVIDEIESDMKNKEKDLNTIKSLKLKIAESELQKEKLLDLYLESRIDSSTYTKKSKELDKKIETLKLNLMNEDKTIDFNTKALKKAYRALFKNKKDEELNKILIKTFLKEIVISDTNVEISFKLGFLEECGVNLDNIDEGLAQSILRKYSIARIYLKNLGSIR